MTPNKVAQETDKSSDNHCQKDSTDTECPLIPRYGRMAYLRHTSTHRVAHG